MKKTIDLLRFLPCVAVILCLALPTSRAAGQMTASQPTMRPAKSIEISPEHVERVNAYLDRIEAFGFSGVVLISQGDKIRVLRASGEADRATEKKNTPATVFDIGSLTKQFTAAAIVKLHTAGKLALNDPISKYFKNVPADKQSITIHQLLTHTSGLPAGVLISGEAETDRQLAIEAILALQLQGKPGRRWAYSNAGYSLLACLIEEVSGQRFEDHLRQTLFVPAGMTKTSFIGEQDIVKDNVATGYNLRFVNGIVGPADEQWYHWGLRGAGGVLLTVEDFFKWELALQGTSVLSTKEKQRIFAGHVETYGPNSHYGYGWQLADGLTDPRGCVDLDMRVVSHGGTTRGFEAKYFRFPKSRVAIIVMANNNDQFCSWMPTHLMTILTDRECPLPPPVVKLAPEEIRQWEGTYASAGGFRISLRIEGEHLKLMPIGQDAFDLIALDNLVNRQSKLSSKDANEVVETALMAWRNSDADLLATVLQSDFEETSQVLIDRLNKDAAKRGGYVSHALIGSIILPDVTHTLVDVRFGNGLEKMRVSTDFSRINAVQLPLVYPIAVRFVPESATRINSYVLIDSSIRSLERIEAKSSDRLRLTGFGEDAIVLERESERPTP